MTNAISVEKQNDVAFVHLNVPDKPFNVLARTVLMELDGVLDRLHTEEGLKGVIFCSDKKDFIVGADVGDIGSFDTAEKAQEGAQAMQGIFTKIADLRCTTVAAIHGQCLGGGLEMALACDYRVVSDSPSTKLGFPEIQLGLIPGAGGTQRAPRLVGIHAGLDLILSGRRIKGSKALKIGLADACLHEKLLLKEAENFVSKPKRDTSSHSLFPKSLSKDLPRWATDNNPIGRKVMEKKVSEMVEKNTRGFYPAPYRAIDAVFQGFEKPLDKGLELEAKLFGQLTQTREAKSLIHLFHATTALKKHPYAEAGKEKFGDHGADFIGVVGSGFMGAGIATVCAERGIRVALSDPNKQATGRALHHVAEYFSKKVEKKRLKSFEATTKMFHVSPATSTQGFKRCDIVIEAVFEDLELKQKILRDLEAHGHPDQIFASNTSAIPIKDIAKVAKNPERVLGMHFFSPVEKMPLLEVVVTDQTAPWAAAWAAKFGQDIGKQVIIVKDSPGFYTTRCLAFFMAEAAAILGEGAKIEDIDRAITDFGFPVGPIALLDEVGIDVGSHVLETMEKAFPQRVLLPKGIQAVIDSGRLGRKNNKGFYLYEKGKKLETDENIYDLVGAPKEGHSMPPDDIVERCLLVFINESLRCLEEGVLNTASDGDVGAVFGLGFPPFWGGPFQYVDHVGAVSILERLQILHDQYGSRFEPATILKDHARSRKPFCS